MNTQIIDKLNSIQKFIGRNSRTGWLTLKDVCQYTKLSPSTIHRVIAKGELKVSKKTGKLLFKKAWLDRFLES